MNSERPVQEAKVAGLETDRELLNTLLQAKAQQAREVREQVTDYRRHAQRAYVRMADDAPNLARAEVALREWDILQVRAFDAAHALTMAAAALAPDRR